MALNAGDLNRRFSLQRPDGLNSDDYAELDTVWGSRRFASGNELLRFATPTATGAWVITIRYRADFDASYRLFDLETEQSFQITSFGDPDGRREQLRIFAVEAQ